MPPLKTPAGVAVRRLLSVCCRVRIGAAAQERMGPPGGNNKPPPGGSTSDKCNVRDGQQSIPYIALFCGSTGAASDFFLMRRLLNARAKASWLIR